MRRCQTGFIQGLDTVGFRIPAHPKTLELIRKYGPLVGPSANLSGHASGTKYEAIVSEFDQVVPGIEDDDFSDWPRFNYFGYLWF